jgi:hypothetical protein
MKRAGQVRENLPDPDRIAPHWHEARMASHILLARTGARLLPVLSIGSSRAACARSFAQYNAPLARNGLRTVAGGAVFHHNRRDDMARAKKPKDLGLEIKVQHLDSMNNQNDAAAIAAHVCAPDDDGHVMRFGMEPMPDEWLCDISLRRGMSPKEAASLLRKIAERIEASNLAVLNLPRGKAGFLLSHGGVIDEFLSDNFDPSGNELLLDDGEEQFPIPGE